MNSFETGKINGAVKWSERYPGENYNITLAISDEHFERVIDPIHGMIGELESKISAETVLTLEKLEVPVELKLYVASQCPHCPSVIRTMIPVAAKQEKIHLNIIDGTIYPDAATDDGVMSVPALILDSSFRDSRFRWIGSVDIDEVAGIIVSRDPSNLSTESLKIILEDGKAGWIARQMLDHGTIFSGFYGLVTHEIWSVRLGAMVVIEELASESPELALTMSPQLFERFDSADIPTRGDILYALGEVGNEETAFSIEKLLDSISNAEVVEAAEEAIDSIKSRMKDLESW